VSLPNNCQFLHVREPIQAPLDSRSEINDVFASLVQLLQAFC
jgi:hypothetical protein